MKKNSLLASCAIALAAITAPLLPAAGENKSPDDLIPFPARRFIENGQERESVILMYGQPSAKLSPDIWFYFDFPWGDGRNATVHIEVPPTLDTALVMFENDRVVHIRLCDSKPVRAFLAKLEGRVPVEPLIAAGQSPTLRSSAETP